METALQTAIISALVSLIVAAIAYFSMRTQLHAQREKTERELGAKFLQSAYELRLKLYPAAFSITSQASKVYDRPTNEVIAIHHEIADKLKEWRNTEVMLVISDYALERSYDLERELRKKPDRPGCHFSEEQWRRMWGKRQKFRHSLRKDIGLLLNTE